MFIQPYSHTVSATEKEHYNHLKEESRTNYDDSAGHKWTKITYKHSSMWQLGMGVAALFSTLAVFIVGAFFIDKIQNFWRNALTGREVILISEKGPVENNVDQIFHQKHPHIKKDQEASLNKNETEVLSQQFPGKIEDISTEQLQAWDFKKQPLTKDQFDTLFPSVEWPEESRIGELNQEQLYDCLPFFDAKRMFLLSDKQIENFDFSHPNFQNHPLQADLIDKGLFKYQFNNDFPDSYFIKSGVDAKILMKYRNRMHLIKNSQVNHIISHISLTICKYITLAQFKMLDFKKLNEDQLGALFFKEYQGLEEPKRLNALSKSQVKDQFQFFNLIGKHSFSKNMDPEKRDQFITWFEEQELENFEKAHPESV